ncbi:aldehyde dehydrogenase family protein [Mesorhizobium sp. B2-6-2]|nr:aldehyde dehydrogenase family protein [Mesorhizobium sp. B2-6-2]
MNLGRIEPLACQNLIDGERVANGAAKERRNPSDTGEVVSVATFASLDDVAEAVAAAREAFPKWARLLPQARADLLDTVGSLIVSRREEIATLLSREEGKTLPEARAEVTKAGQLFKFYAGEALRLSGRHVRSLREGIDIDVVREPVGVAALITPWNFPIVIPAWKLAPALAYGNCAVLKPSELTSGCAQLLSEIMVEAGLPNGVFQMVMGGGEVGAALVSNPEVDLVSFTGSSVTGSKIAASMNGRNAQLQLELGGKNPLIVMADANLEGALDAAIKGAFYSTGQRCTASSRIIVDAAIHDRFAETLLERVKGLRVGHALDPQSNIGPLVSEQQRERVLQSLDNAKAETSGEAWGGSPLEGATPGHFVQPALFIGTSSADFVNRHEIFGPVASLIRADSLDHAIEIANDTPYGLSAGIYTASHAAIGEFRRRSTAGMLMINLQTVGTDYHVPFGGNGESGFGVREMGPEVVQFFTRSRTIYVAG